MALTVRHPARRFGVSCSRFIASVSRLFSCCCCLAIWSVSRTLSLRMLMMVVMVHGVVMVAGSRC